MKSTKVKETNGLFIVIGLVLLIHGISLLLPFVWMIMTSFKGRLDYQDSFLGFPTVWHTENYTNIYSLLRIEVIKNGRFYNFTVIDMLYNSLLFGLTKPFFGLLSVTLCSYVVAKYDFFIRKLLFNINIFVMVIPIVGSLANTLTIYKNFHIYNNMWALIIFPGGPFGFTFLLLYGMFKAIPTSYSEAVFIDGGGHLTVFIKIILPLMIPTLLAHYILGFIGNWNDYSTSLIFMPSVPTLAYGLYIFQYDSAKYGASLPQILAAFTICSIPSVLLYVIFQPMISKSMMIGGLKE
ncbi:MAG: carbohydrate ABC transporter permease [Clostridia bacterium]|nr:carbohydrate ABC transporter permease [Clostridia bacterium]